MLNWDTIPMTKNRDDNYCDEIIDTAAHSSWNIISCPMMAEKIGTIH